jgi:branched-subunit amino acid aminotransferase/4-amino-4-deoxychorismate lyase
LHGLNADRPGLAGYHLSGPAADHSSGTTGNHASEPTADHREGLPGDHSDHESDHRNRLPGHCASNPQNGHPDNHSNFSDLGPRTSNLEKTWVDGRFVAPGEYCLAAGERGFLYGDGLFETVRLYAGRPFAWERHAARLADGCQVLGIPYPEREIAAGMQAVLEAVRTEWIFAPGTQPRIISSFERALSGLAGAHRAGAAGSGDCPDAGGYPGACGSLRLTVTRGAMPAGARGVLPPPGLQPTVMITARPGEPYPPELYRHGQRAVTVSFSRNHRSPLVRLKSLNCLELILGRREAAAAGADEGIFCNLKGELAEGTASNLFLVCGGDRIITPPVESGLLPGIARSVVIALGRSLGLTVCEQVITRQDFGRAQEAFLTNSLLEVMPLVSCDGIPFGSGSPGAITLKLLQAYRDHVQRCLL